MEEEKTKTEIDAGVGAGTLSPGILSPGTIVAGRYETLSLLGSGGMGQVYKVLDRELHGEVVALKLLHPQLSLDPSIFERFRNEVALARSLAHPNIVRTFDLGKAPEGYYFLTMEYVEGRSLKELLQKEGGLQIDRAVQILRQILGAVSYAHERGIIHRDLKPANVLSFDSGEIKLVDFGTARLLKSKLELTPTGQIIGTPYYMSPEQIRGEEVDVRSDIYALGIIGYELVMGKRPFESDNYISAVFKQLNEAFPRMAIERPEIPEWYENAIGRAVSKIKSDRFASATEFAQALRSSKPESTPRRRSSFLLKVLVVSLLAVIAYSYRVLNKDLPWHQNETTSSSPLPSPQPSASPTVEASPIVEASPTVSKFLVPELPSESSNPIPTQSPLGAAISSETPFRSGSITVQSDTAEVPGSQATPMLPDSYPGELFFRKTGSLSPSLEFHVEEFRNARWSLSIPRNQNQNLPQAVVLELVREGETSPILQVSGTLISLGSTADPEVRFGGPVGGNPLLPGSYTASVTLNTERVAFSKIELR